MTVATRVTADGAGRSWRREAIAAADVSGQLTFFGLPIPRSCGGGSRGSCPMLIPGRGFGSVPAGSA